MRILALLIWIYYNALNQQQVTMRDGDWKVLAKLPLSRIKSVDQHNPHKIKDTPPDRYQIFKITGDIKEKKELSSSHLQKLAELTKKLTKHFEELVHNSHVWGQSK
ncbi:MAG: hypothetical protein P8H96_01835 [Akkermansiaceae bacterium]|nr:hypothetical protein [Akkermansiaceae bacterium]